MHLFFVLIIKELLGTYNYIIGYAVYLEPPVVPNALYISALILTMSLWDFYLHFIDDKTEAQRS
jgi:hypothetical protein